MPKHQRNNHIQSFIRGDNDSLGTFFEENKGSLVFYTYSLVKNKEIAADIVLEVFYKLLSLKVEERKDRFSEDENHFRNTLYKILRNKTLDHIKVEKNRLQIIEREFNVSKSNALNNAEEVFVEDSFSSILGKLGHQQAKVIEMHMKGYSLDNISEELGISYNTARNTLSTARSKIKKLWKTFFE